MNTSLSLKTSKLMTILKKTFLGLFMAFFSVFYFTSSVHADFAQDLINNQRQQVVSKQTIANFKQDVKNNKLQEIRNKKNKKQKSFVYKYDLKTEKKANKLQEIK